MAVGSSPNGYINPGTEWDLQVLQNTDDQFTFQFSNGPVPFVLTGYTMTLYVKTSPSANDATSYQNNPVITFPLLGQIAVNIPKSVVTVATSSAPLFYHVDGFESSTFPDTTTFVFGTLTVVDD